MKFTFWALLAIFLFAQTSFAQTSHTVKGVTIDSVTKAKFSGSVSVLNAKDSVLRKFTYADDNGAFSISGLPAGKYLLFVTYPGYDNKMSQFTLAAPNDVNDLGNVGMSVIAKTLGEVTIKSTPQEIKIKGDTLEYNAKAYVIQPNSKVEDLIRQMPGVVIDKNGKITVNGQAVPKVLVDGEEFFGDDPTLVTQNLRGDMVSSVQIYDRRSDQASFTGIDDGQRIKTINVKLKEDKKRGIFGKISAGAGTDDYYEAQGIFNKFTARSKFAAYGTFANTGKTGLGAADNSRIGSSNNYAQIADNGGIFVQGGGDDDLDASSGNYNGNGLPEVQAGGAHYDTKIKNDATLNANYKVGTLDVKGVYNSSTQVTIPGNKQDQTAYRDLHNNTFRQKADLTYFTKLDTSSTLKIGVDAITKHLRVDNNLLTTIVGETGNILTNERRITSSDNHQKGINLNALYTYKFKKPTRTFSWAVSQTYAENIAENYLYSVQYRTNKPDSVTTDQYKPITAKNTSFSSNMNYTEPLSKYLALQLNYGLGISNTNSDKPTFDKSGSGLYNSFNNIYSNDFKINTLTNRFGGIFNYRKNKTILNFGTRASLVDYEQTERYSGRVFKRSFVNWSPQATYQYQPSAQKVFLLSYSGNMSQPSVDQLQPILNNSNTLNTVIGNPDLKAQFSHSLQTIYQSQKIITRQSLALVASGNLTENQIVPKITNDPKTGKTVTQYVNLSSERQYNVNFTAQGSQRITGTEVDIRLALNGSRSANYSFINDSLNRVDQTSFTVQVGMQTVKFQKYELQVGVAPTYSFNKNSLIPQNNNNAAGLNVNARGALYLPLKFILNSDVNYRYSAKTQNIPAINMTILNASLSKTLLKEDKLKLTLSGINLLNANPTLSRSVTSTQISQSSFNTIMRYFLLSVSWDFTKFGTSAATN
ncbi:outer membrane beta-barrel protein [Mucilaginibacter calamicampi]|uniref:Outer membrane beta-barrel protein n=1 Tax=Mucilaginibacter calamicampi TaxID=1302352 RepID=A0ABW2YT05_9SPHI